MHHKLLFANRTAVKQLVMDYLITALSLYTSEHEILSMKSEKIPLHKGREGQEILYISGVALCLSKSHNCRPMEIVEEIAAHLSRVCYGVFIVKKISPGWIYIELTPLTIAAWLHNMVSSDCFGDRPLTEQLITSRNSSIVFAVQYAHARCCSLLRLAQQESLIRFDMAGENFILGDPVPWLDGDETLLCKCPHEGHLINQLVKVTDDCICPHDCKSMNWEKIAGQLSQSCENFWQYCQIWGDVKVISPELAQARIGLLLVTQLVLKNVLTEKMGVFAPLEL